MHLLVAPIVLPAIVAALAVLGRRRKLVVGRVAALAATSALVVIAAILFAEASSGAIRTYRLGDWPAPFGIVLVLDRLSALMLLVTSLLGLVVLVHVVLTGLDRRGWHFHPMFQFQLLGLNGAFLTGDLFNLFVFFEILLIASYGLMLHGQGAERLQAGVHYVVVNLVGSTLFLIAVGILYGVTGTLNMADMALRMAAAAPEDQGLIRLGAQLLILVFALKAALLPLHLWLPRTYASTSAPVAALFAILTKVGVYAILRVTILIFGEDAGAAAWAPADWLLTAAILTMIVGFIGAVAAPRLRQLAAYALIGSTGTLLIPAAVFTAPSVAAALFYLPHSTFAGALVFLLADQVGRARQGRGDALVADRRFPGRGPLGLLFLLAAVALAGLPPLSGIIGKLLILDAVRGSAWGWWIWGAVLGASLLAIVAFAGAGSTLFWKVSEEPPPAPPTVRLVLAPAWALVAALAMLTVLAGPATSYATAAADQLFARGSYIGAVLGEQGSRR